MNFEQEINKLEKIEFQEDFVILKGTIPILFSAPHTMIQEKKDGTIKLNEPYTKAIALYLNKYYNVYSIVKNKDTGVDSNRDNHDDYNIEIRRLIKENNIKLAIDLHGASRKRNFDIEFGTLNNLTANLSTITKLEESFKENGIKNIKHNTDFKGGAITQGIYEFNNIEAIQLEINRRYRDYENIELLEKVIESLVEFIEKYIDT